MAEFTPTLPRCCSTHRLDALDAIDAAVLNDVRGTFDRMVGNGWPPSEALAAVRTDYRTWILGRFDAAIELGVDLLELEVER